MKKLILFVTCSILLTGCKNETDQSQTTEVESATTGDPLTTQIAMANGFDNFQDVKQLKFTFNVKVNDTLRSSRTWNWFPAEDKVELIENGNSFSYDNDGDFDETEKAADQKFINDTYWLLFPYQLEWSDYETAYEEEAVAPISKKQMHKLSVKYNNEGGYTPGDTYHIFFNDDHVIEEWTFESSGGRTLNTTWEDYETFNGIKIAKTHKSEDGSFELFFTDIEVIK